MIRWWKTRRALGLLRYTFSLPSSMTDLAVFKFARFAISDSQFRGVDVPDEVLIAFNYLDNNI